MKIKKIIAFVIAFVLLILLTACADNQSEAAIARVISAANERGIDLQYVENQRYEFFEGNIIEEVMYYALCEYGEYYFTPGNWKADNLLNLIAVSEDAIKFTKDWLNYEDGGQIAMVYGNKEFKNPDNPDSFIQKFWGGGGGFKGEVFINISDRNMPMLIVHEVAHAILRLQEKQSNFPLLNSSSYIEEGLCNVIDYLFFLETEHIYDKQRYGTNKEKFNLHKLAPISFNHSNNFEDETEFGNIYPQLMSYDTAASFVYYLLSHDNSTKEDFMRIFEDINLTEEVYGADMDKLIAEWLEFIEQYK